MIENTSKAPLNFSPLKCTYLDKKSFQYHKRLVRKMKFKSGHLEVQLSVNGFQNEDFHNKSMEDIGPQGVDSFDIRGLIGRIYVGDN